LRSKTYASNQLFDFKEVFFGEGKKSVRILLKKIADHFTEGTTIYRVVRRIYSPAVNTSIAALP